MMNSYDVLKLYDELSEIDVVIWVDGGWGVDALLEKQTRPHSDLDIVIQQKDLEKVCELLGKQGFRDVPRADTTPWNFVLGNSNGGEIDLHVIVVDSEGNGIYGPLENELMYPAPSLAGIGEIDGRRVKCISAEWAVKFHSGYDLKEKDYQDVAALCDRFGIPNPYTGANLTRDDAR